MAKGERAISLLEQDYEFVYVHVNAPDEASHAGLVDEKIRSFESIDKHIVKPILDYFNRNPKELGGISVTTDHYTNLFASNHRRVEAHSIDQVPFAIFNGESKDTCNSFSEVSVRNFSKSIKVINHLDFLPLFINSKTNRRK